MTRVGISALVAFIAALIAAPTSATDPVSAAPVRTEEAACNSVKARVSVVRELEVSAIAFCDFIVEDAQPEGYYVLALHGRGTECGGICSTNMGWFAIERATGRVFDWDVAEWKLGRPI